MALAVWDHTAPLQPSYRPLPSPHAFLSLSYDPLPPIPNLQNISVSSIMGPCGPVSMPAHRTSSYGMLSAYLELDQRLNLGGDPSDVGPLSSTKLARGINSMTVVSPVDEPNVTTAGTAKDSETRRKTDATLSVLSLAVEVPLLDASIPKVRYADPCVK